MQRENLEIPWPATKLGPFQDHPHSPRVNILEKLSQCLQHYTEEVYHLSLATLHLI